MCHKLPSHKPLQWNNIPISHRCYHLLYVKSMFWQTGPLNLNKHRLTHIKSMVLMATVLVPLGTTICTLEFPRKFLQQFIVFQLLLQPITLGLDFSHNYQIGIVWFSTKQLHLHQGPQFIIISDPTSFPLHINQISTLPPPHLLVKTISQVTVPSRTLATVPATLTCHPNHSVTIA